MNVDSPKSEKGADDLDPARRAAFAQDLLRALAAHCPGSRAELKGSLARGTADAYSDIDIAWTVPDDRFDACATAARDILEAVRPLDFLRTDPELQNSRKRRLLFAAFRGLPLFWRVDLEIGASSVAHQADYDQDNPAARGDDWSRPASALANAVAATKAVLRGQPQTAQGLLERGFRRIDAPHRVTGQWFADIGRLADTAADREPGLRSLAGHVVRLAENHLAGMDEEAPRRQDGRR
ncbi:nucleotidyltransferase domain-containing protein [Streptomyces sp. NPDC048473]|uniref:nucleotidyltransferase domain-containing protein n=1 Tax=unclassified Streptomyces TaxID=2593676 RepID=UPI003716750A